MKIPHKAGGGSSANGSRSRRPRAPQAERERSLMDKVDKARHKHMLKGNAANREGDWDKGDRHKARQAQLKKSWNTLNQRLVNRTPQTDSRYTPIWTGHGHYSGD